VADPNVLNPAALGRVLVALDLAHAIVLEARRGKSTTAEDVDLVRQAVVSVKQVLDALDETRPNP